MHLCVVFLFDDGCQDVVFCTDVMCGIDVGMHFIGSKVINEHVLRDGVEPRFDAGFGVIELVEAFHGLEERLAGEIFRKLLVVHAVDHIGIDLWEERAVVVTELCDVHGVQISLLVGIPQHYTTFVMKGNKMDFLMFF